MLALFLFERNEQKISKYDFSFYGNDNRKRKGSNSSHIYFGNFVFRLHH